MALERLERAREVHRRGEGRLIEILRLLLPEEEEEAGESGPWERDPALIAEAQSLVERLRTAGAKEPLSQPAPPAVGAPDLEAPALGEATTATASTLESATALAVGADGPLGSVPGVLRTAAEQLDTPIALYEWVRNSIRAEQYYGEMKGAVQTYLEGSGNDADTAAVLIALLRARGIPARFVRGTAVIEARRFQRVMGTETVAAGLRVLERAGIPHEAILGAGDVAAVKWERVWAEAYLPYANYRGALISGEGKFWIPLDPGFKELSPPTGLDAVGELGFAPRGFLDEYLGGPSAGGSRSCWPCSIPGW